jgi:hypothetical protein
MTRLDLRTRPPWWHALKWQFLCGVLIVAWVVVVVLFFGFLAIEPNTHLFLAIALGGMAGAILGTLIVFHQLDVWMREVSVWSANITDDVNAWGATIEEELSRIREELSRIRNDQGREGPTTSDEGIRPG